METDSKIRDVNELIYASSDEEAHQKYQHSKAGDPLPNIPPALLKAIDIKRYVSETGMIYPFHPNERDGHLKQASYAVKMIGSCIYWDENNVKHEEYIDEKDEFVLKGNSIAFISLEPRFRIPYYIGLRFNLKIRYIHCGILLGTGPLVDPGFDGKLAIPLHNLTMNDYRLRGGDDLIWFEFTKINYIDQYSPKKKVEGSNAISKSAEYIEFESKKNISDINDYLYKAYNGQPIRSSLSEIQKTAIQAKKKATQIQWGAFGIALTLLVAVVWPVINLITDRTNFLKTESNQLQEQIIVQGKEIIKLKEQINSIKKEIQDHGDETQSLLKQHIVSNKETVYPETVEQNRNE